MSDFCSEVDGNMQNVVDNILYCIVAFEIVVYGIHNTPYDEGVNHTQGSFAENCVRSLFMGKRKYPDIMTKSGTSIGVRLFIQPIMVMSGLLLIVKSGCI